MPQQAKQQPRFARDDIVKYVGPRIRRQLHLYYIRSIDWAADGEPIYRVYEEAWGVRFTARESELRGPQDED